jgi:hypothetical protein
VLLNERIEMREEVIRLQRDCGQPSETRKNRGPRGRSNRAWAPGDISMPLGWKRVDCAGKQRDEMEPKAARFHRDIRAT